jgi:lysophospholipase II
MSGSPSPHVVPPLAPHTYAIILLHGRGSNGPEFAKELLEARTSKGLSLQEHLPGWKWVFPTSQTRFSTLFQEDISEWFDIYSLTDPTLREELQTEGLQQSVAFIHQLIDEEVSAVGGEALRVVLGGISQGCATAARVMLSSRRLGAFIGFCGWMPSPSDTPDICGNRVFLSHTKDDGVVDFKFGLQLRNTLQHLGMNVTWRSYNDGGHWVKEPEGFDDLADFLTATCAAAC